MKVQMSCKTTWVFFFWLNYFFFSWQFVLCEAIVIIFSQISFIWFYCFLVFADYANCQIFKEQHLNCVNCQGPVLIYCTFLTTVTTGFSTGPKRPEFSNSIRSQGFQIAYSSFRELILKYVSKAGQDKKKHFCAQSWSHHEKITYIAQPLFLSKEDAFHVNFSIFQCNILQSMTEMTREGRYSGFPPGIKCDCLAAHAVSVSSSNTQLVVICKLSY